MCSVIIQLPTSLKSTMEQHRTVQLDGAISEKLCKNYNILPPPSEKRFISLLSSPDALWLGGLPCRCLHLLCTPASCPRRPTASGGFLLLDGAPPPFSSPASAPASSKLFHGLSSGPDPGLSSPTEAQRLYPWLSLLPAAPFPPLAPCSVSDSESMDRSEALSFLPSNRARDWGRQPGKKKTGFRPRKDVRASGPAERWSHAERFLLLNAGVAP